MAYSSFNLQSLLPPHGPLEAFQKPGTEPEAFKGSTPWFIPKHSPFAVLNQEKQFRAFREKLAERKDIEWIFLITDSEENFGQMRRTLGRKYECVQLYKSYLENFRINTQDALKA